MLISLKENLALKKQLSEQLAKGNATGSKPSTTSALTPPIASAPAANPTNKDNFWRDKVKDKDANKQNQPVAQTKPTTATGTEKSFTNIPELVVFGILTIVFFPIALALFGVKIANEIEKPSHRVLSLF